MADQSDSIRPQTSMKCIRRTVGPRAFLNGDAARRVARSSAVCLRSPKQTIPPVVAQKPRRKTTGSDAMALWQILPIPLTGYQVLYMDSSKHQSTVKHLRGIIIQYLYMYIYLCTSFYICMCELFICIHIYVYTMRALGVFGCSP